MENNIVGWFEIPATDMDRAIRFYEQVLGLEMFRENLGGLEMAFFPMAEGVPGAAGGLVRHASYTPSADGTVIYFTSPSGDLANELGKVEDAGGKVLQEKKLITEDIGYMGLFLDSKGNRVALHSRK